MRKFLPYSINESINLPSENFIETVSDRLLFLKPRQSQNLPNELKKTQNKPEQKDSDNYEKEPNDSRTDKQTDGPKPVEIRTEGKHDEEDQ